ncbi:MAG: hypothetical protein CMF59_06620 [Leptospiraceae bacterium]|nr:hypothetical protein [Leptospiraceae bacterium]
MSRLTVFSMFILILSYACSEAMIRPFFGPPPERISGRQRRKRRETTSEEPNTDSGRTRKKRNHGRR